MTHSLHLFIFTNLMMKILNILSLAAIGHSILLNSCIYGVPPQLNTPEPSPHDGVFVSGEDTLFFNGDGKTVSWHFSDSLPELGVQGTGEYYFTFHHGLIRYDGADALYIYRDSVHGLRFISYQAQDTVLRFSPIAVGDYPEFNFKKVNK